jgi:glycosyltransferase involved in cell wall biosynthesis
MKYSIIIPAHNEAQTIEQYISRFIRELPQSVSNVLLEVIIVENGSKDDTRAACERLREAFPNLIHVFSINRGSYGEAVKRGILETRGSHLSILECDFLDAKFVQDSISLFQAANVEFIIASKRHPDSLDRRPLKRRILTWGFNRVLNSISGYPGSDTHGLKSLETQLAKKLCELSITTDEIFQTEIVLLAWRLGRKIEELPIQIEERRATSVSIVQRLPKIVNLVSELRKSIKRFPITAR